MKRITYKDLQLEIEQKLFNEIKQDIQNAFGERFFERFSNDDDDKHFFEFLKYAVEIKDHYLSDAILSRISENLELKDIDFRLYLYQSATFNVSCFPRKMKDGKTRLQIFVSQHFFNNLREDEQVAIIGHEIAHFLFNHFDVQATKELMNSSFDYGDIGNLKSNLIYHAKMSEITADVIGLVSNDFNYKAYSTALIKYATGLNDSTNSIFSITPLIDLVLKQYEGYSKDPFFNNAHTTYPLMPVRVKIINTIAKSNLVLHFGKEVSDKNYIKYKGEYNDLVNGIIKKMYPEIFPEDPAISDVLIPMSAAVMLADGKIDEKEVALIKNMIDKAHKNFQELSMLFIKGNVGDFRQTKNELIKKAIKIAKQESFNKCLIVPIIRRLILVAASDEVIEISELRAIYQFAKEFGISKKDIIFIIKTQYKI